MERGIRLATSSPSPLFCEESKEEDGDQRPSDFVNGDRNGAELGEDRGRATGAG